MEIKTRLLCIFRHGEYRGGNTPLTEEGRLEMKKLKGVLEGFITEFCGAGGRRRISRLYVSFSDEIRAVESVMLLRGGLHDNVWVADMYKTERDQIAEPEKIVKEILDLAGYFKCEVVIAVAHGSMPSVIAETARELTGGKKLARELKDINNSHGFIVDMRYGSIFAAGPNGKTILG